MKPSHTIPAVPTAGRPAGSGELTTRRHWDEAWGIEPRWRLPSSLVVGTANIQRVLRRHIRPGMRVIELGCAPGKMLAWVAVALEADVAGLDYSEHGIAWARQLFDRLGIRGDLRCEDAFETSLPTASADVVYSWGLIEHFEDPRRIVEAHVRLLKPGGRAILGVPHYGGLYGRLQRWFDPGNLALHNLRIMSPQALEEVAPPALTGSAHAYPAGRLSPWLISISRRCPRPLEWLLNYGLNGLGLIQPVEIRPLCPLLVLEIVRRGGAEAC